ncbi:glutamate--cysteine ligase [Buchnera aphidicola (Mindarus keteleerifoliae)]|uniref:glutamate--cysteine ligase n=1 Tax=Buchnera aphidicola TaxID=9 RepID=UPI0031B71636
MLISNISKKLNWLKKNRILLNGISRGIEREAIRIKKNGNFSLSQHPKNLGYPLTHSSITTDFSENLLELVTPKCNDINQLLDILIDIHSYVSKNINDEYLWPLSMPCFKEKKDRVLLAQYGNSNFGKIKTLYRKGLQTRYGLAMNLVSGIHYNFSMPIKFWRQWIGREKKQKEKKIISDKYLHIVRNFYQFGWIIPYFFGASPAIYKNFLIHKKESIFSKTKTSKDIEYLPWATSLRLSELGHSNESIRSLPLTFNNLNEYLSAVKYGIKTPSKKFKKMNLFDKKGNFQQINTNILQMENEFYAYIRPKCKIKNKIPFVDSLKENGIEYLEIRALDINPFSSIGINKIQIFFLDIFILWCLFNESPNLTNSELIKLNENWEKINLEGRKPNKKIRLLNSDKKTCFKKIAFSLFKEFKKIAKIFDLNTLNNPYQKTCKILLQYLKNPNLTYSSKILNFIVQNGFKKTGIILSKNYKSQLKQKKFKILNKNFFLKEKIKSKRNQKEIKNNDIINFRKYLKNI